MSRLLLADDDEELTEMLADYLREEGFAVELAHDGEAALAQATSGKFDLLVLDIMMPKMNGLDVLRNLRQRSRLPVLMLTARGDDVDSIVGLELGADDYLAKPAHARVLVARIRAILRRAVNDEQLTDEGTFVQGAVRVELSRREVSLHDQPLELTSTEFSVLAVLISEAGHVVTRNDLCQKALGRKLDRYDRSIDMHVSSLRKKLAGADSDGQELIKTVRGVGYQYVV
jgi:DNA-binding response OmpR family regulator